MKKSAFIITTTLLLISTSTLADVYIGVKGGKSWLHDACASFQECNDENVTFGTIVGYEVSDLLSIEAGYDYLGKFTTEWLDNNTGMALTLAPKLNLSLRDDMNLYGKFGGAFVKYDEQDDYSYIGAIGLEVLGNDNMTIRLEYQYISDFHNSIFRASGNSATIGFVYKFGENKGSAIPMVVKKAQIKPVITFETFKTQKLNSDSFKSSSAILVLTEKSKERLTQFVNILNTYPKANIQITGHTDSTGSASYNYLLSEARAISVADELMNKGIDTSRILIDAQGENSPIASNATKEGRKKNRRAEITIPEFDYQTSIK